MSRPTSPVLIFSATCLIALLGVLVWIGIRKPGSDLSVSPPVKDPAPSVSSPDIPQTVTFNAHIRPILSDKCFSCHGFDSTTRKENLRLDTQEGAFAALESDAGKHAIVPGNPKESIAWQRIHTTDEDDIMPPPDFHKPLSEEEKQLITRWIAQGAEYQQHWAFAPVEKPAVPETGAANPIDAFVRKNLTAHNLQPSPQAEKHTLLRRLSLDLTGLPPTPAELEAFLNDDSPDAYGKQVERLLASPHYGERMAVPWLDAVRFADTVGYHGDQNARVFPYRDYVIDSFNANKPFDQFTREQIAGDLMPDATDEQKIATGFLRLNLMTREGGAQPGEYLAKSTGDRVRAIGAAWLGLTTGCAECHDHKFDPFTARDFYSLGAFFNDVRQWGVYADYEYTPNKDVPGMNNDWPFPPEIQAKNRAMLERLESARDRAAASVADIKPEPAAIGTWRQSVSALLEKNPTGWLPLAPATVTSSKGTPFKINPDQSVLLTGAPAAEDTVTVEFRIPANVPLKAFRLEALPDPANNGKVGRQENGKFTLTPTFTLDGRVLDFTLKQADRRTPEKYHHGDSSPMLEDKWQSAPAVFEEPSNAASLPHHAVYHFRSGLPAADGGKLTLTLASADVGKFRLSVTPFADPVPGEAGAISGNLASAIKTGNPLHPQIEAAFVMATFAEGKLPAAYRAARDEIIASRAGYAHSVISQSLPPEKIPTAHILTRGNWMTPAEEVSPAYPGFLSENIAPTGKRLTRIDLADWLVSKDNPLTARHFVNRLWKQFFGKGFSNVLDDLGNQGEWPSHPELIDWLAADFMESGWDVKHIVKLIVTSETYKQVSAKNEALAEIDPANRLLSEQSPRRLEAEFIRDNALAISGLLADDITGGPSILPYQPDGYWVNLNFPERQYPTSSGTDQYRRGLYTHWQRTFMHPMLAAFDAPSREECSADRFQSNSPQQALTLLNDPTFVEAAKALAARVASEKPGATDVEKIDHIYHLALSRPATDTERKNLTAFLEKLRTEDKEVDPIEQLCRVVLNLHETITRY